MAKHGTKAETRGLLAFTRRAAKRQPKLSAAERKNARPSAPRRSPFGNDGVKCSGPCRSSTTTGRRNGTTGT